MRSVTNLGAKDAVYEWYRLWGIIPCNRGLLLDVRQSVWRRTARDRTGMGKNYLEQELDAVLQKDGSV